MANVFSNILSIPDIRKRVLFTIGILIVFRIGVAIPTPGVDASALDSHYNSGDDPFQSKGIFSVLDMFSGGALANFSIFALGIMPYITSSIIMQLLGAVVPSLQNLQREGGYGRKKIQQYTRYGTIVLCVVQSMGILVLLSSIVSDAADRDIQIIFLSDSSSLADIPFSFYMLFILTQTTGTLLLLWMGEQVTERGVGNGTSLLIYTGIISTLIPSIIQLQNSPLGSINILILVAMFVVIVFVVSGEQQATRRIPVQYARRVVGGKQFASPSNTYIPFKMNPAGVIPVIFASAVVMLPAQIMGYVDAGTGGASGFFSGIASALSPGNAMYIMFLFLLTVIFAFFYTQIYFNTPQMSEDLRRQGGFIPGIRPGANTAEYLSAVLNRITFPGALFLGFIAILPDIILNIMGVSWGSSAQGFILLMGGTSLLIIVGVALDTMRQLEGHLLVRNRKGVFRTGNKLRGHTERRPS